LLLYLYRLYSLLWLLGLLGLQWLLSNLLLFAFNNDWLQVSLTILSLHHDVLDILAIYLCRLLLYQLHLLLLLQRYLLLLYNLRLLLLLLQLLQSLGGRLLILYLHIRRHLHSLHLLLSH